MKIGLGDNQSRETTNIETCKIMLVLTCLLLQSTMRLTPKMLLRHSCKLGSNCFPGRLSHKRLKLTASDGDCRALGHGKGRNQNCVGCHRGYERNDTVAAAGLRIYTPFRCTLICGVESTLSNCVKPHRLQKPVLGKIHN